MTRSPALVKSSLIAIVAAGYGFVAAAFMLAAWTPDQPPPPRTCIPIYHETGLECCKET